MYCQTYIIEGPDMLNTLSIHMYIPLLYSIIIAGSFLRRRFIKKQIKSLANAIENKKKIKEIKVRSFEKIVHDYYYKKLKESKLEPPESKPSTISTEILLSGKPLVEFLVECGFSYSEADAICEVLEDSEISDWKNILQGSGISPDKIDDVIELAKREYLE